MLPSCHASASGMPVKTIQSLQGAPYCFVRANNNSSGLTDRVQAVIQHCCGKLKLTAYQTPDCMGICQMESTDYLTNKDVEQVDKVQTYYDNSFDWTWCMRVPLPQGTEWQQDYNFDCFDNKLDELVVKYDNAAPRMLKAMKGPKGWLQSAGAVTLIVLLASATVL